MFRFDPAGRALIGALLLFFAVFATPAIAEDSHTDYYYPKPQTIEEWTSRAVTLPDASRGRRIAFATALTKEILRQPYPPQYAVFTKGDEAQKLLIVGLHSGSFDTLFRARALLAQLTSLARLSPIFQEYRVQEIFTFFELLKLLGFKQLTISDGDAFAHQVQIK